MKVIFLDFDGVITTEASYSRLDLEKMKLVKKICDETGAKIVISSSWRYNTLEKTIEYITNTDNYFVPIPFLMPELVVGVTPRFEIKYKDEYAFVPRGVEIRYYLHKHKEIDSYVIIDDDSDMLLCQKDNFVQTDSIIGITEEDVRKAIKILNMDKKRQMYHSLAFSFGLHVKQMKFIFQNKEPEQRQIDFLEQKVIKENNDSIFRDLKLYEECIVKNSEKSNALFKRVKEYFYNTRKLDKEVILSEKEKEDFINNSEAIKDLKLLWRFHDCSINIYKKLHKNVSVQKASISKNK